MELYVNYPETEKMLHRMRLTDFSYHAHLHNCLEFSFCREGQVQVTVDGRVVALGENQGIVIPPNSIHSYETPEHSLFDTLLVGLDVLPELSRLLHRKTPEQLWFSMDGTTGQLLSECFSAEQSYFAAKALLYKVCDRFTAENRFTPRQSSGSSPCVKIMEHIRGNFRQELTLQSVADATGYSYHYISRMVRKNFGVTFTQLLAQYRIAYACNLLEGGDNSISQVALAVGFGSIRSFNRVFRQLTGMTPAEYIHK